MAERHTIPARKGLALRVGKGQRYKVVNTHGTQIVDHWVFNAADVKEFMSMEHCRVAIDKLSPVVGDAMVTNQRRPIITLLDDTSPGVHDTLVAACDIYRYRQLGATGYHDNCTDNLANAMKAIGLAAPETPCPFNLFQNTQYVAGQGHPVPADRVEAGAARRLPGGDGRGRGVLGLPAGHAAGQQRRADRGARRAALTPSRGGDVEDHAVLFADPAAARGRGASVTKWQRSRHVADEVNRRSVSTRLGATRGIWSAPVSSSTEPWPLEVGRGPQRGGDDQTIR